MFLEILQNSQVNTCARVSFLIKLQASFSNFIKKETLAQVFSCEFCEIYKATFLQNTSGRLLLKDAVLFYECKFLETNIFHPLIRTRTCAYQRLRNFNFSQNLAQALNGWSVTWKKHHRANWICLKNVKRYLEEIVKTAFQTLEHFLGSCWFPLRCSRITSFY